MIAAAITPELTFDETLHQYRLDGRMVPSVTQILRQCGIIDASWYTPEGTLRGTFAHEATALDDRGILDESTVDDVIWPYLHAWRLFRKESGGAIIDIERRVWNDDGLYAGTLDRLVMWHSRHFLLDIKTGAPGAWHALQTAAYAECVGSRPKRASVYLKDTGRYSVVEHASLDDIGVFRAATALWHWKRNSR